VFPEGSGCGDRVPVLVSGLRIEGLVYTRSDEMRAVDFQWLIDSGSHEKRSCSFLGPARARGGKVGGGLSLVLSRALSARGTPRR